MLVGELAWYISASFFEYSFVEGVALPSHLQLRLMPGAHVVPDQGSFLLFPPSPDVSVLPYLRCLEQSLTLRGAGILAHSVLSLSRLPSVWDGVGVQSPASTKECSDSQSTDRTDPPADSQSTDRTDPPTGSPSASDSLPASLSDAERADRLAVQRFSARLQVWCIIASSFSISSPPVPDFLFPGCRFGRARYLSSLLLRSSGAGNLLSIWPRGLRRSMLPFPLISLLCGLCCLSTGHLDLMRPRF